MLSCFFFFNDTATTEIYTLSLHDALPISCHFAAVAEPLWPQAVRPRRQLAPLGAQPQRPSPWLSEARTIGRYARPACARRRDARLSPGSISGACLFLRRGP